jgi:hypothetical protein
MQKFLGEIEQNEKYIAVLQRRNSTLLALCFQAKMNIRRAPKVTLTEKQKRLLKELSSL